jgi:hypothetical protein
MNTNDIYYTKYSKYKNKYLKCKEQFGGALGTEPCPKVVSEDTKKMSVSDFLRNTACVYNQIEKHIPEKLAVFDYCALQEANRDQSKHKLTIADLKSRNFPTRFFAGKDYPLVKFLRAGYLLYKLIEEAGFTFRDMKAIGISLTELKEKGGYGRNERNTPEILQDLKEVGYTIQEFHNNSFSLKQIKDAGFNLQEIMSIDKYPIDELIKVGFKAEEIEQNSDKEYTKEEILTAIKYPNGNFNDFWLRDKNRQRKKKIDLSLIKDDVPLRLLYFSGYSLEDFKSSGFKSSDLINFIKENLDLFRQGLNNLKSIFTIEDLLEAKTEMIDILNIGYNICELKKYGFGLEYFNIRENTKLLENLSACYTLKELLDGYADLELRILELCNYSKDEILSMHYTLDRLIDKYGIEAITTDVLKYFNINDIFKYKIFAEKFKFNEKFRIMIKQKIIDRESINPDILTSDLTIENLYKIYKLTFDELIDLGYDITFLPQSIIYYHKKGENLDFFKEKNFTVKNLREICRYTATEFRRAGYTVSQLKNDFHPLELKDAGYTIFEMREGGFSDIILYFLNFDFVPILEFINNHFRLPVRQTPITEIQYPSSELLRYVLNSDKDQESWVRHLPTISEIMRIEILLEPEISIEKLITIFKTYEDIILILYFFKQKEIPMNIIFDAMRESFPDKNIDHIIDHLKFIYEPRDFVESRIPQSSYQEKLPKRDLVLAGIDVEAYVEQVEGEFYPYIGDPIGDAHRSARENIPLRIKNFISSSYRTPNLNDLLSTFNMSRIKETLEYYFRVPYMTPFHPMYKGFKKIDDEIYKRENGL